jgi:hypothetical protein
MEAAGKRADRENKRRRKQQTRINSINQASSEVDQFDTYIRKITSFHTHAQEPIDWKVISEDPKPQKPKRKDFSKEQEAKEKLAIFTPNFFINLFKLENFWRERLEKAIPKAKLADEKDYEETISQYEKDHQEWKKQKKTADNLLKKDVTIYNEVLKEYGFLFSFKGISVKEAKFPFEKGKVQTINILAPGIDLVPTVIKKQNQSGTLSVRDMPKTRRSEIFEDMICSFALGVGAEFLAVILEDMVIINALVDMVNQSTGHQEATPVLSIAISSETIKKSIFIK